MDHTAWLDQIVPLDEVLREPLNLRSKVARRRHIARSVTPTILACRTTTV